MRAPLAVLYLYYVVNVNVSPAQAYGSGAPDKGCPGIGPIHFRTTPQNTTSPYSLTVSKNEYAPGEVLTVTLSSPSGPPLIGGFMLQARPTNLTEVIANISLSSIPVGEFVVFDSATCKKTCSQFGKRALTHTRGTDMKQTVTTTWQAPNPDVGPINFYYAVAQNHDTYWSQQLGATLKVSTSGANTGLHVSGWIVSLVILLCVSLHQ